MCSRGNCNSCSKVDECGWCSSTHAVAVGDCVAVSEAETSCSTALVTEGANCPSVGADVSFPVVPCCRCWPCGLTAVFCCFQSAAMYYCCSTCECASSCCATKFAAFYSSAPPTPVVRNLTQSSALRLVLHTAVVRHLRTLYLRVVTSSYMMQNGLLSILPVS